MPPVKKNVKQQPTEEEIISQLDSWEAVRVVLDVRRILGGKVVAVKKLSIKP